MSQNSEKPPEKCTHGWRLKPEQLDLFSRR